MRDREKRRPSMDSRTVESESGPFAPTPRSSGRPLDASARQALEPSFGHSFESVRIHDDRSSDELARSVQANAVTVGQDVFFREGAFDPDSHDGLERIAHELTHTIQQGVVDLEAPLGVTDPRQASEREAESLGARAVMGEPVQVQTTTGPVMARDPELDKLNDGLGDLVPGPLKPNPIPQQAPDPFDDPQAAARREMDKKDAELRGQKAPDPLGDAFRQKPQQLPPKPDMLDLDKPKQGAEPPFRIEDPLSPSELNKVYDPDKSWPPILPDAPAPQPGDYPLPDDETRVA
jgi:hypothetical protein